VVSIAPSILSADFANLERDLNVIAKAGADWAHVDVMDGVFVPNITIGIPVTASLSKVSPLPLDVHLMITQPHRYVEDFAKAGADLVCFHIEAQSAADTTRSIELIHAQGKKAGIAIKPDTRAEAVFPWLDQLELVLVMTVEPGFGGQSLIEHTLDKVRTIRNEIDKRGLKCYLEVDGGVNDKTAAACREAGADMLVAGSAVFKSADIPATIAQLRG